jgi:hypothetical protein
MPCQIDTWTCPRQKSPGTSRVAAYSGLMRRDLISGRETSLCYGTPPNRIKSTLLNFTKPGGHARSRWRIAVVTSPAPRAKAVDEPSASLHVGSLGEETAELLMEEALTGSWRKGDVLLAGRLIAHARSPCVGWRRRSVPAGAEEVRSRCSAAHSALAARHDRCFCQRSPSNGTGLKEPKVTGSSCRAQLETEPPRLPNAQQPRGVRPRRPFPAVGPQPSATVRRPGRIPAPARRQSDARSRRSGGAPITSA